MLKIKITKLAEGGEPERTLLERRYMNNVNT
jgi:hypothetical protein